MFCFLDTGVQDEGISQATINPHLEILADMNKVHRIIYVSIERTGDDSFSIPRLKKIIHQPFYSKFNKRLLSKVYDFIEIPRFLRRLARGKSHRFNHVQELISWEYRLSFTS